MSRAADDDHGGHVRSFSNSSGERRACLRVIESVLRFMGIVRRKSEVQQFGVFDKPDVISPS